jgi:hypothetical protein
MGITANNRHQRHCGEFTPQKLQNARNRVWKAVSEHAWHQNAMRPTFASNFAALNPIDHLTLPGESVPEILCMS